jgi:phage I-like protein
MNALRFLFSASPRLRVSGSSLLTAWNTASEWAISAANELSLEGEWLKLTPWGDFPNVKGLQRIEKTDGDNMVAAFNSLRSRASRLFLGLPVYVGHPDVAPDRYPDKRRYGRINALDSRADGLFAQVAFNDLGKLVIEQGHFTFASPAWYLRQDGQHIRPVELISVGLTNSPQIPGDPWAKNETKDSPGENIGHPMPEWLKKLLTTAGLLKADGTEQDAQTAVNELVTTRGRVTELETKLTTATNERTAAVAERDAVRAVRDSLGTQVSNLTTAFNTERSARREREVEVAINEGRIKLADKAAWNEKLTATFDTGLAELKGLKAAINTQSQVGGLGARKSESLPSEPVQNFITAVNEQVKAGKSKGQAIQAVINDQPELHRAYLAAGASVTI